MVKRNISGSPDREFYEAINKAVATNRDRDKIDRDHGNPAVPDCPMDIQVSTVKSAIRAGMISKDWDCIAEAYAMLDDILTQVRSAMLRARRKEGS